MKLESKVVGSIDGGIVDLENTLKIIGSQNNFLYVDEGKYVVGEANLNKDYVEDWCGVDEKFYEHTQDNDDLEEWEKEDIVNSIPDVPRFSIKEYFSNKVLQDFIDDVLSFESAMFILRCDLQSKELYVMRNKTI